MLAELLLWRWWLVSKASRGGFLLIVVGTRATVALTRTSCPVWFRFYEETNRNCKKWLDSESQMWATNQKGGGKVKSSLRKTIETLKIYLSIQFRPPFLANECNSPLPYWITGATPCPAHTLARKRDPVAALSFQISSFPLPRPISSFVFFFF